MRWPGEAPGNPTPPQGIAQRAALQSSEGGHLQIDGQRKRAGGVGRVRFGTPAYAWSDVSERAALGLPEFLYPHGIHPDGDGPDAATRVVRARTRTWHALLRCHLALQGDLMHGQNHVSILLAARVRALELVRISPVQQPVAYPVGGVLQPSACVGGRLPTWCDLHAKARAPLDRGPLRAGSESQGKEGTRTHHPWLVGGIVAVSVVTIVVPRHHSARLQRRRL
jgi:hypothetical protein